MTNTTQTNTNDVMGVINPITNTHNNIDDLSFFDFKVSINNILLLIIYIFLPNTGLS